MTEYFEVLDRDGTARSGVIRLDDPVETPAVGDDIIANAGSAWVSERSEPQPRTDVVTMLPHHGLPPGTPDPIAEAFSQQAPSFEGPTGAVVTPKTAADYTADVYALSIAQGIVGHASAFREAIVAVRGAIPPDAALYLSGVATPANVSLLAYAGVDLVDTVRAQIAGSRGTYLTPAGSTSVDDLAELPCACPACADGPESFDREDCIDHNVAILQSELATVRQHITAGRLRDYVSAQVRHTPWHTAALREFDQEAMYLERHAPLYRHADLIATTDDDLRRPAVTRFADRVTNRFHNRLDRPLVLLPCSASKPYSQSQSHRQFRDAIGYRAHRVALSSPVGVVPQELECTYPAQHYDVPVTGRWSATERTFVQDLLDRYLDRNAYASIVAHVPPGSYRQIVDAAVTDHDVPVTYTVTDHPTTDEALDALADALDGQPTYTRTERRLATIRGIADYQFGAGAGDALFADVTVEAPYPKHRIRDADGELLATLVPTYGLLALTVAGARRWEATDVPTKRVHIDAFVPHGDVLAPGVRDADDTIRPGDEVIITGPAAYGVGRAATHGVAMAASTRGVAVDVRHCEER